MDILLGIVPLPVGLKEVSLLEPVVLGTGFFCVAAYINHLAVKSRQQQFLTNYVLEEERQLLLATQKALHGMLSSLWDASCTCNSHGIISSSTPHLEQLLGATRDLAGNSICAFAANEVEEERLQDFLINAITAAEEQALSLQCALRSKGSESEEIDAGSVYDVSLYVIKLPPVHLRSQRSHENCHRLFLGFKAGAPEVVPRPGSSLHVKPSQLDADVDPGSTSSNCLQRMEVDDGWP